MVDKTLLTKELEGSLEYLERATRPLDESDSNFSPGSGMMSASQQLAHIASTVHWLLDGAFSPEGFDMNFEHHSQLLKNVTSIEAARSSVREAYSRALKMLGERSDAEWKEPIVPGPVMGGAPRVSVLLGIVEHTAHHRGALSVYTRLCGKTPLMPYLEM